MANWRRISLISLMTVLLTGHAVAQAKAAHCHEHDVVTIDGTITKKTNPSNGRPFMILYVADRSLDCNPHLPFNRAIQYM